MHGSQLCACKNLHLLRRGGRKRGRGRDGNRDRAKSRARSRARSNSKSRRGGGRSLQIIFNKSIRVKKDTIHTESSCALRSASGKSNSA